jgi:tetratricopeptide (TPR) repeat protein
VVALSELHQTVRSAIEEGQLHRPRRVCEAILDHRPDNLETILLLSEIRLEAGDFRLAIDGFERVLAGDPECFLAYAGLGIANEALRDDSAAYHWFMRAFDLNPVNQEIRRERDRLFQLSYPGSEPAERLSDVATATSLLRAGLPEQAVDAFRRAMQQEPGRAEIKLGLAEAYWLLGIHGETIATCKLALADAPRAVKAFALQACVAAAEGDLDEARLLIRKVHVQDPEGRLGARFLESTALAQEAVETLDLKIDPSTVTRDQSAQLRRDSPPWVSWMRTGLWQVLRLLWIPPDQESDAVEIALNRLNAQRRPTPPTGGPLGRRIQANTAAQQETAEKDDAMISEEVVRVASPLRSRARRRTPQRTVVPGSEMPPPPNEDP